MSSHKMYCMFTIILFLFLPIIITTQTLNNDSIIFNYNNTYKFNEPYVINVSKYTEYVMEFGGELDVYDTPARVTVVSESANQTYPLFVTARQQKGVFSWQLPIVVETAKTRNLFNNVSKTLCPHNNVFDENLNTCEMSKSAPIIHLTSSSPEPIQVTIVLETVKDFYIKLNSDINVTSTPSQPKYYFFPFKQEPNLLDDISTQVAHKKNKCDYTLNEIEKKKLLKYSLTNKVNIWHNDSWFHQSKSVIVMIESDDDVCGLISIQNHTCPVFDNERDILYDGYYFTMTRRGGITLTQDHFPLGFYIVFIVKNSDEECIGASETNNGTLIHKYVGQSEIANVTARTKSFRLTIVLSISYADYAIGALAAFSLFISFYIAAAVPVIVHARKRRLDASRDRLRDVVVDSEATSSSTQCYNIDGVEGSYSRRRFIRGENNESNTRKVSISTDSDSISTTEDVIEADLGALPSRLSLADLSRKSPKVLASRSKMYLWNVLTVSVFYTLPVIQLVITYQRLLNQSGNQDLCYYNFLCAHPLSIISDINHVLSNIGYISLGTLFLLLVWRRNAMYTKQVAGEVELGIPQHFGLLYAMGVALITEGILSAAYHVCPNSMNFQFDTSFMYITGVLSMVKIYQSRHPDINARAHATLAVLALIIFIGLVGILNPNIYFWIVFTILHLTTCLVLTFKIYYMGRFKLENRIVYRAVMELARRPLYAITPTYCARFVLLILANVTNIGVAAYGLSTHSKDIASQLLLIVMSNLFLYTLFYIAMKLVHKESISWYSWLFIALTYTTWFTSSYFFLNRSSSWAMSPAESRRSNSPCILLQLYDTHDVWHFLSAIAMFFSFNMYLTIDDKLVNTPRNQIYVF